MMIKEPGARDDEPPLIFKILIGYFLAKPEERLHALGIFRVTSTWPQISSLEAHLVTGNYEELEHVEKSSIVANMIKYTLKFLRIPLFPFKHYFELGKQRELDEQARLKQVKEILADI